MTRSKFTVLACLAAAGLAAGWIASDEWGRQPNWRAAAALLTTSGHAPSDSARRSEAGRALPAGQVFVGGRVLDLMPLLGSEADAQAAVAEMEAAIRASTPDEAAELFHRMVESVFRLEPAALAEVLGGLDPFGPWDRVDSVFEEKLGSSEWASVCERALQRAFATDPERALLVVQALPDRDAQSGVLRQACAALATRDPEAVLEMVGRAPLPGEPKLDRYARASVFRDVFSRIAARDAATAAARWEKLPPSDDKESALLGLASSWAGQDSVGFFAWCERLNAEAKATATRSAFSVLPADSLRRWLEQHPQPTEGPEVRMDALRALAGTEPAEAIRWLHELEWGSDPFAKVEQEQLERAWRGSMPGAEDGADEIGEESREVDVVEEAILQNPSAAGDYTAQGSAGPLLERLLAKSPTAAVEFSMMIPDADRREEALLDVAAEVAVEARGSELTPEAVLARVQDPVARQRLERRLAARQAGLVGF